MDPRPIPFSSADLERRRLESTINLDLHSLSLLSASSASDAGPYPPRDTQGHGHGADAQVDSDDSCSSDSTIEYPRTGVAAHPDMSFHQSHNPYPKLVGPHGTPRAGQGRKVSQMSERSMMEASPVSTAGHHVSAVTLAEGVFKRAVGAGQGVDSGEDSEWDPDRSLGRLVGELGKAMKNLSPRPSSPFSPTRSPRSPSPYTTHYNPNLSFTLNRNDPLPSPPVSRHGSGSGSSAGSRTRISSAAPSTKPRRALGESNAHNIPQPQAQYPISSKLKPNSVPQRPASAPTRLRPHDSADVTGMTGLMETPAKGLPHGSINKNGNVGEDAAAGIPASLATLHARLRALENENSVSRRRVRELEAELERAKVEVETAKTGSQGRLREVIGEKTALEDLVKSLRTQLSRLTVELEHHKTLVSELRQSRPPIYASPPKPSSSVTRELVALRQEVERLGNEVHRLGGIVEQGLETRKKARGEETIRLAEEDLISLSDEDVQRVQRDVDTRAINKSKVDKEEARQPSKLRQGLHRAGSPDPQVVEASIIVPAPPSHHEQADDSGSSNSGSRKGNKSRTKSRPAEGPSSPFPSIREEDEIDFFETSRRTAGPRPAPTPATKDREEKSKSPLPRGLESDVPPQTVLMRVIAELEADFKHYKSIYSELAEQYKILDAASAIAKRHVLAEHLKEVIDTLEQKADQISALNHLLSFQDKEVSGSEGRKSGVVRKSVPEVLRMVRESLGEEGLRRLEEDGVKAARRARR